MHFFSKNHHLKKKQSEIIVFVAAIALLVGKLTLTMKLTRFIKMASLLALLQIILPTLTNASTTDTIKKVELTLVFTDNSTGIDATVKQKMIDAFFKVYPQEMARFNANASREVIFAIDTAYKGVAATSGHYVRYNPTWFVKHPEDIDVVTHEVMHIVQAYGRNRVPGWLTEGIADYVRYKYGVNNEAAGWKLTDFKAGQSYTNAYRITARFLVWVEKNKNPETVNKFDAAMRSGKYSDEMWKELTGKTVDELWQEYSANPVI